MKVFSHILVIMVLSLTSLCGQIEVDTSKTINIQEVEQEEKYGLIDMFSGNPGKAALYSLIFPGAGQFYNKRYWKVPIALAAEGLAAYILIDNIKRYNKWNDEWEYQLVNMTNNPEVTSVYDPSAIKRVRDNARQQKDYSWVALIGIHIIITAEAFIDRHLIEFDVSDDLSLNIRPANYAPGAALVITF